MRTAGLVALIALLLSSAIPVAAQEHFYDNGVYVGLGVQASILKRDKKINYGFSEFCDPTPVCIPPAPAFNGTNVSDTAASPTFTLGYKFNEANSLSLTGDWSRFSAKNSLFAPSVNGFTSIAVDGQDDVSVFPGGGDTSVDIDWKSNVYNLALEYQRRLTHGELGGVQGLLGMKLRYERQKFEATPDNDGLILEHYRERLTEYLFGPYAGLKFSFKPQADSRFHFNLKGTAGWYFKSALFQGRNVYFNNTRHSENDRATNGTLFVGAGLDLVYAISRNWFVDAGYEFNWIKAASHIFNTGVSAHGIPSRIINTSLVSHAPGIKLIYKFD